MSWLADWSSWLHAVIVALILEWLRRPAYRLAARVQPWPSYAGSVDVAITGVSALATAAGNPGAVVI